LRDTPSWQPISRAEIVQRDVSLFMFSPPKDMDAWNAAASDLKRKKKMAERFNFAGFFTSNDFIGDGKTWNYVQRSDREFYGSVKYNPTKYGASDVGTISEYGADSNEAKEPELVILETGSTANGIIRILTGCEMNCDEIFVK
jgi:hypothetical protein